MKDKNKIREAEQDRIIGLIEKHKYPTTTGWRIVIPQEEWEELKKEIKGEKK